MANIDLSSYNLVELKGLQHTIEKEIKSRQKGDVAKARQQIFAIAQQAGVSVRSCSVAVRRNPVIEKDRRYARNIKTRQIRSKRGRAEVVSHNGSPKAWQAARN